MGCRRLYGRREDCSNGRRSGFQVPTYAHLGSKANSVRQICAHPDIESALLALEVTHGVVAETPFADAAEI